MPKDNILVGDTVYIVGHTTPDVDAIVSAHGYQAYRHSQGDFDYIAVRCDEVNEVTKWIYRRWDMEIPAKVDSVAGRRVVLVDHTDPEQRPRGWEEADIIEVVDHHKLKLETTAPPKITIRPYGSTTTLIAQKMMRREVRIEPKIAGLMLSAIIDDTLALRSPITTLVDKQIAGFLAVEAGISELSTYARELFSQKDIWHRMKPKEVCTKDSKMYEMGGTFLKVSQVETMDNLRLSDKASNYMKYMDGARKEVTEDGKRIDVFITLITDLIRNDCILLVSGDDSHIGNLEKAFGVTRTDNGCLHLPGIVSRKKQIIPVLVEVYGGKEVSTPPII